MGERSGVKAGGGSDQTERNMRRRIAGSSQDEINLAKAEEVRIGWKVQ